jgi:hypothetical protein
MSEPTGPAAIAMNAKLIEDKQLAERYLFGRLPPPEARFFESMLKKTPALADELQLPEALRRAMRLLDETGTEWREHHATGLEALLTKPWVALALAGALVLALGAAAGLYASRHGLETKLEQVRTEAEQGLLNPPTRSEIITVKPARPGEGQQTYLLGTRAAPTLAELRVDVRNVQGSLYRLVIRRADGAYWGRLDNQLRDSNGELRLALNSGAFAADTYDLEVDAVNLRGDGAAVGYAHLRVEPR